MSLNFEHLSSLLTMFFKYKGLENRGKR